ncbi:COG1361 family protein [Fodinicola feengrottensis]|nr:DUF11 domain-containing protein [Fodinicola feengrottensis]
MPAQPADQPRLRAAGLSADLAVSVRGTSVPVHSAGKPFTVIATNLSTSTVSQKVTVTVTATASQSGLLVGPTPYDTDACKAAGAGRFTCAAGDLVPGGSAKFDFSYAASSSATPRQGAGSVTGQVSASTLDPNLSNNSAQARIDIVPAGSDLSVSIPDSAAVPAGRTATTYARIGNFGSANAPRVVFSVHPPNGATLAGVALRDGTGGYGVPCPVASDRKSANCSVGTLLAGNYATARILVSLPSGAASGSTFTGGVGTAAAASSAAQNLMAERSLPVAQSALSPTDDPTDNSDTYACPVS